MVSHTVPRTLAIPGEASVPGPLAWFAQTMASLFTVSAPAERTNVRHLLLLAALIVVGGWVRFLGLGSVGLHGDEETMAMAVRGILAEGIPVLPSGLFYPRGLTQLYLMAVSVSVFGETEWALRLPSALCGIALIGLSFVVARRFLRPQWALGFAAVMAFLPEVIIYSQTARMYIFLLTCIAGSMAFLFAWESSGRTRWLVGAVATLIIGLDMQSLAVGAALILLLPGIVAGDTRKLLAGFVATVVFVVAFVAIDGWVSAQYPTPPVEFTQTLGPEQPQQSLVPKNFPAWMDALFALGGLVLAALALRATRLASLRTFSTVGAALLVLGVALQVMLFYHLAAICYLIGAIIVRRDGPVETTRRLAIFAAVALALAAVHAAVLYEAAGTPVRLVGALIGQPSVWPYVRVAQLSVAAGVLVAVLIAWGCYELAHARRVPDYWLLAVLGIWAPVFALGAFAWNVPPRYTSMSLVPLLLCAFAFAQRIVDNFMHRGVARKNRTRAEAAVVGLLTLGAINPVWAAKTINSGYATHPDHKGAAEFMRAQQITSEDIVLAEDVLQQTYYLGEVDYWLIGPPVARKFVMSAGEGVVDFYTGTPLIVTKEMLEALIANNSDRRIFIIGSGEDDRRSRRGMRGTALDDLLESDRFETIFIGRDGKTRVLRPAAMQEEPKDRTRNASGPESPVPLLENAPA